VLEPIIAYVIDAAAFERLKDLNRRIYADQPLVGDERRDLANAMDAILHGAMPVSEEEAVRA
jgi:hypothetical protein